jgi:cyanophycin synthetase
MTSSLRAETGSPADPFAFARFDNLSAPLTECARHHPDRLAIRFAVSARYGRNWPGSHHDLFPDGCVSFAELERLVDALVAWLRQQGVRAGDVLALSLASEFAQLVSLLAAARCGAAVHAVSLRASGRLRNAQLAQSSPAWCLTDMPAAASTPPAGGLRATVLHLDLEALDGPTGSSPFPDEIDTAGMASRPFLLVSGSGSTGRSKLICISHRCFLDRLARTLARHDAAEPLRLHSLVHLDHPSPKELALAVLFAGGALVLVDRGEDDTLRICRDESVTLVWATVSHLEALLDRLPAGAGAPALPTVRALYVASSIVGDSLRARVMARLTPALHVRYGTNESGGLSVATPDEIRTTAGTVGRPLPGLQLEIVDGNGQPVGPGVPGEIRVRGPGIVDGYPNDPEETARRFRDEWFNPFDRGQATADGQLVHGGRTDDMMIVDGMNLHPLEIDSVLAEHPAVRELATLSVVSRIHQQIPVSAVVLRADRTASATELLDYAFDALGPRAPRAVLFFDRLPRTELGKIDRRSLLATITTRLAAGRLTGPVGGMRSMKIGVEFTLPVERPETVLHPWFSDWLDLQVPGTSDPASIATQTSTPTPAPSATSQVGDGAARAALDYLAHVLALAACLLRAGRLPIFATGRVDACQAIDGQPARWRAQLGLPMLDLIDRRCGEIALQTALACCARMLAGPPDDASREAVGRMFSAAAQRLATMNAAGKSTLPVLEAAHAAGVPFLHLGYGVYQLGWGSRGVRIDRSTTARDAAFGARLSQSKHDAAALLRSAGFPAPVHGLIRRRDEALPLARRIGWPLVVKPADGDRGEGVSVDLNDEQALLAAFDRALAASPAKQVLVERQVPGVCHRLFVTAGRLLYAVKRMPKSVIGDGRQTVAELIDQANRAEQARVPWARSEPWPVDAAALASLECAGYGLDSVPSSGAVVPLRRIESTADGGYDEDMTASVHPANIDLAVRAAALFDLEVAGIDIISADIVEPWYRNGAIVNEVNFSPLLGGGEISRRHLPEFIARVVEGNGRIPVEVLVDTDAALALGRQRQRSWLDRGVRCYLTSARHTLTPDGVERPMAQRGLGARCRGLLLDKQVDALVVAVASTDELATLPFAVDPAQLTDGPAAPAL